MTIEKDEGVTWTKYQRQGVIEARPWTEADAESLFNARLMKGISVSQADHYKAIRCPPVGFCARNPDNHADQWYIAPDYFAKHYCAALSPSGKAGEGENESTDVSEAISKAVAWLATPEGSAVLRKNMEAAEQICEQLRQTKIIPWEKLHAPFTI